MAGKMKGFLRSWLQHIRLFDPVMAEGFKILDHSQMTMVRSRLEVREVPMKTMPIGEFKAKCLGVMAEVNATGKPILVTKRGKPFARVLPFQEQAPQESPESIFGFMRGMGTITGDIVSSEYTDEEWDRMFNEKWDRFEQEVAE
jgi:prevent-host-death family protein